MPTPAYEVPSAGLNFIGFSSRKLGKITLHDTKDVTAVKARIREPILNLDVAEYELTAEEIAAGEFMIPALDTGDIYMAHMDEYDAANTFPEELELNVTVSYNTAEGGETLEYTAKDKPEQGWGLMYWPDSEPATDWSYPGFFRFSTYESQIPVSIVIDEPEKVSTTEEGIVISVSISINGQKILAEDCEITEGLEEDPLAELYGLEQPKLYKARLLLKRPEWAGEHGTIHLTVVQQLAADGSIWTTEQDTEY